MGIKTLIDKVKAKPDIKQYISIICDMEFYDEPKEPESAGGRISYSIEGKAFSHDGSGGEFILLEDGSVGYSGSEGQCGRIAENLEEFLTLIVNCSCFLDYTDLEMYEDIDELKKISEEMEKNFADDISENFSVSFFEAKLKISQLFSVNLYENIAEPVLMKFYKSNIIEPKFQSFFKEKDGSLTPSENIIL